MKKAVFALTMAAALIAAPALATEMARKAPPPAPVASYNWSGWYAGVNVGGGWEQGGNVALTGDLSGPGSGLLGLLGTSSVPLSASGGAVGGGQIGYNWQFSGRWVAGIEADFDGSGIRGSSSPLATNISAVQTLSFSASQKLEWFGTVRGRLGIFPTDRLLVFATGGLAYGHTVDNAAINLSGPGFAVGPGPTFITCATNATCVAGASSKTSTGWTLGGGAEFAAWNNVTLRAEYLFIDLGGGDTFNLVPSIGTGFVTAAFPRNTFQIVRAALNYKF